MALLVSYGAPWLRTSLFGKQMVGMEWSMDEVQAQIQVQPGFHKVSTKQTLQYGDILQSILIQALYPLDNMHLVQGFILKLLNKHILIFINVGWMDSHKVDQDPRGFSDPASLKVKNQLQDPWCHDKVIIGLSFKLWRKLLLFRASGMAMKRIIEINGGGLWYPVIIKESKEIMVFVDHTKCNLDLVLKCIRSQQIIQNLKSYKISSNDGIIYLSNLKLINVLDKEAFNELSNCETSNNDISSRSCCLVILSESHKIDSDKVRKSINLVNLAASERIYESRLNGKILNESKYINLSKSYKISSNGIMNGWICETTSQVNIKSDIDYIKINDTVFLNQYKWSFDYAIHFVINANKLSPFDKDKHPSIISSFELLIGSINYENDAWLTLNDRISSWFSNEIESNQRENNNLIVKTNPIDINSKNDDIENVNHKENKAENKVLSDMEPSMNTKIVIVNIEEEHKERQIASSKRTPPSDNDDSLIKDLETKDILYSLPQTTKVKKEKEINNETIKNRASNIDYKTTTTSDSLHQTAYVAKNRFKVDTHRIHTKYASFGCKHDVMRKQYRITLDITSNTAQITLSNDTDNNAAVLWQITNSKQSECVSIFNAYIPKNVFTNEAMYLYLHNDTFKWYRIHILGKECDEKGNELLNEDEEVKMFGNEAPNNDTSPRSYCIFIRFIEPQKIELDKVYRLKLNEVHLAAAERVYKSGFNGKILNESKYIYLLLIQELKPELMMVKVLNNAEENINVIDIQQMVQYILQNNHQHESTKYIIVCEPKQHKDIENTTQNSM